MELSEIALSIEDNIFKNKTFEGIYYSRFIASWYNEGGAPNWAMKDWLRTLTVNGKTMPEEVIKEIYNLATNGKLELESSAKNFIKENRKAK